MLEDNEIKNFDNFFPLILALGVVVGIGAHSILVGSFIVAFIFLISHFKTSFISYLSIPFIFTTGALNIILKGRYETFLALSFLSGFFAILPAFIKKIKINPPKPIIKGFITAIYTSILILCIPFILGQTDVISSIVAHNSSLSIFNNVNIGTILIFFTVLAAYYYLSKIKFLSSISYILSIFIGCLVNYIYKLNTPVLGTAFENYNFPPNADFGNFFTLLILSILIGCVLYIHINYVKKIKKDNFLIASSLTAIIAPFFGGVGGGIYSKSEIKFINLFYIILLLLFIIFYKQMFSFVPTSAIISACAIQCFYLVKSSFKNIKCKNLKYKINFALSFLTSVYNILLGIIISGLTTLILRKKNG